MGPWTTSGDCSNNCGGGVQSRSRSVLNPGTGGGRVCPLLVDSRQCNMDSCPTGDDVTAFGELIYFFVFQYFLQTSKFIPPQGI